MGASSSGGGAGGNTGADAGFFVSQDKKKSKLSKKNQALVDASFKDRGAEKIKQGIKGPPSVMLAGAILSKPLQAGSKVTREFFTNKVLGSKNYKGTSKADFEAMSVSQQEQIYGDYMSGRQSGRTDAYGNPISSGGDNNNQPAQPVVVKKNIGGTEVQTTEAKLAEEKEEAEEYDVRKTKRRGRRQTILTSQSGARGNLVLGKPTLLGA